MLIDISNINKAFIVIIIITITSDSVVIGLIDFHTAAAISRELAFLHNQVKFWQDFTFAFWSWFLTGWTDRWHRKPHNNYHYSVFIIYTSDILTSG